jgi:hypothetical protein
MDRRNPIPEPDRYVMGFECPICACKRVRLGIVSHLFFYLVCDACGHVWSQAERRDVL